MYACSSCYQPASQYIKRIVVSDAAKNVSFHDPFPFSDDDMPLCNVCLELVRKYAYEHVIAGPCVDYEVKVFLDLGFYEKRS